VIQQNELIVPSRRLGTLEALAQLAKKKQPLNRIRLYHSQPSFLPRRHMHLARFIREESSQILQQWEKFTQKISANPLPKWILRDHAAQIVDLIAQQLSVRTDVSAAASEAAQTTEDSLEYLAGAHVRIRIDSGFDLAQIVSEYCALRSCVLSLWREHEPDKFEAGALEITRFDEIVDACITAAVAYYKDHESQYRDRFLGILGHDLRNPINAIVLAAAALAEQRLTEAQLKIVTSIQNSAHRLTGMVNDIIDFARGRLGSPMPISTVPLDLGLIAREVVDEVQAANPRCQIHVEIDGDLKGEWDAGRLKQMIANLLLNGIQYGTGDFVKLKVTGENDFITLETYNEGPPIPPELLPSIFDPLVRGLDSNRNQQGLGLGLFIVDEIVRAHHGTITVNSSRESGTAFVVRLPRRR
jgi:signal transduction histidine kinase